MDDRDLHVRLEAVGVPPDADPLTAWRALRAVEGPHATVMDLYLLEAERRGIGVEELRYDERMELARATLPSVWPGFEGTSGSERPSDGIVVVEYDPQWPQRYDDWRARLIDHLGQAVLRIEHVGSTSVPGLPAKPIIDIQISVADLAAEDAYVPGIEAAGVQLRSRDAFHRYFRPFADRPREVHVHVCQTGSAWERDHLLFRDHLRAHPEARAAYATVKRQAAARWSDDGFAYNDTKTEVILDILTAAREEPV
ncbi:MAG: GrpB family protein [Actinobacteria bacterium]|nr:GrpB family protein [Actinomycetota bacterium]MCA1721803.1 GrpB family protein [Actinomycetota bacterium]